MLNEPYKTRVHVDTAKYDEKEQALLLYVTLFSGDKKILVSPKTDWHYGAGEPGDFPDKEMHKLAELLKGKKINWEMHVDANLPEPDELDLSKIGYNNDTEKYQQEIRKRMKERME